MRRDIEKRSKDSNGKTVRHLSCGHIVVEPHGSKAHKAVWANCVTCEVRAAAVPQEKWQPTAPVLSTLEQLQRRYKAL